MKTHMNKTITIKSEHNTQTGNKHTHNNKKCT